MVTASHNPAAYNGYKVGGVGGGVGVGVGEELLLRGAANDSPPCGQHFARCVVQSASLLTESPLPSPPLYPLHLYC